MDLSNARRAALKSAIEANPTWNAFPKTTAGAEALARELNKASAVIVWKPSVAKADVLEQIAYNDLTAVGVTADMRAVLHLYLLGENVPCDRARVRNSFAQVFGATGTATRLLALWKRPATFAEAVFATGATGGDAGTDANPHNLPAACVGDVDGVLIENVRA